MPMRGWLSNCSWVMHDLEVYIVVLVRSVGPVMLSFLIADGVPDCVRVAYTGVFF